MAINIRKYSSPALSVTAENIISCKHADDNQKKTYETIVNHQHHQHTHRKTKQCKPTHPLHRHISLSIPKQRMPRFAGHPSVQIKCRAYRIIYALHI